MKHFKQREKRKHSIKRQMIAVFAGMNICLLAIAYCQCKVPRAILYKRQEMQFIHVYEETAGGCKKGNNQ